MPVGLLGEFNTMAKVRMPMASITSSGSSWWPCSARVGISFTSPPFIRIRGAYSRKVGSVTMNCRPGAAVADSARYIASVAPVVTRKLSSTSGRW